MRTLRSGRLTVTAACVGACAAVACAPAERDTVGTQPTGGSSAGGSDSAATTGDDGGSETGRPSDPGTSGAATATGEDPDDRDDSIRLDVEGMTGGGSGDGGTAECPCSPTTDRIYVLGVNGDFAAFDPAALTFTDLGRPCVGAAFSMAVDRTGFAWMMENSGDIQRLDLSNPANCEDPGYVPDFGQAGMAFVSNSAADPCDRLYLHSTAITGGNGELGVVDPASLAVSSLGATGYSAVELTGTGDGRLFGFAMPLGLGGPVSQPTIVALDKATATVLETHGVPEIQSTGYFAFAFYGGDFYIFHDSNPNMSNTQTSVSSVTRVDWDESEGPGRTATTLVQEAPLLVVGAGVSTCAPLNPVG